MASYITKRKIQFSIFDHHLGNPDWTGKRVLDFGGSAGNVLLDPGCRIEPGNYWCIEISRDAVIEGQRRHPDANFVFYDRYNYEYNPTGTIGQPIPDPGVRFDFIIAWSVITHNNEPESLDLIDQLTALLADNGKLAFTFVDPTWTPPSTWSSEPATSDLSHLNDLLDCVQENRPDIDPTALQQWAKETEFKDDSVNWTNLHWALEKQHAVNPKMDVAAAIAEAEKTRRPGSRWSTVTASASWSSTPTATSFSSRTYRIPSPIDSGATSTSARPNT